MNEVIGFLFISGFGILFIYMGGKYVLEHLPILAYCWSLGFIAALVAACWAISSGVLNKAGQPLNDTGKTVLHVAKESVDLVSDAYFIACLLILILAPQILAYIICGLFGRATNVYLFKIATRYAALSFIKTTATGSGIILAFWLMLNVSSLSASLSISNLPEGYTALLSWLPEAVATSVFFLVLSIIATIIYSIMQLEEDKNKILKYRVGKAIHEKWATRRMVKKLPPKSDLRAAAETAANAAETVGVLLRQLVKHWDAAEQAGVLLRQLLQQVNAAEQAKAAEQEPVSTPERKCIGGPE